MTIVDTPDYLKHLVIYEIATKNFTSPNGPQSGTFASLTKKISYLKELGINAIWLSGHQWCDEKHFFNIWTEYACIRPDRLDESLGSEVEFRTFIETAHEAGIKVFLDVITHGVMKTSPLVMEHPNWFNAESWGMFDYDWYGDHPDLDEWWIETWFRYVRDFDVDGFRLDVAHYRNDLWAKIRHKSKAIGKDIAIIAENGPAIRGVVDMLQHGEAISHNYGLNKSSRILHDPIGYFKDRQQRLGENYTLKIFYKDGTVQDSQENHWYEKERVPEIFWEGYERQTCVIGDVMYENQIGKLTIKNYFEEKKIENIQLKDTIGQLWNSNIELEGIIEVDFRITVKKDKNELQLEFPIRIQDGQLLSTQISCHDGGWIGFPSNENPYCAQGSRYLMGYVGLLSPGVPVFMAGEEFNADYRPLPNLSPNLFGDGVTTGARWLYGNWLDWEQLNDSLKNAMFQDVKRLIAIRHKYSHLIHGYRMKEAIMPYATIDYSSEEILPTPYYYQDEQRIIVVAANPNIDRAVTITFDFSQVLSTNKNQVTVLLEIKQ